MERRSVLLAFGAAAVGGCTSGADGSDDESAENDHDNNGRVADEVVDWSFTTSQSLGQADTDPDVAFDENADEVVITGILSVGSSTCREAAVDIVEYDDGDLHTRLISDFQDDYEDRKPCTADDTSVGYDLTVEFDAGLPEHIVIEKHGEWIEVPRENQ